jgi:negative regulator of genetic competence, sporulation and motility
MNKVLTSLVLLTLCITVVFGQDKVKEKDVKGEWQMIIDIDFDELEDEMEEDMEEDSWLGWAITGAVGGLVEDVMDEIDIQLKFMDEGKLKITVHAFGEEEIEYGEWYINRDGQLVIIDEDDHDDDDVWMKDGKNLVSFEKTSRGLERQEVYMKRL